MDQDGLEVILSPLQLSAVLEFDSIHGSSCLGERFWGAANVVGGAVELVGAAALLLTPEPTTITKIAGGALAVHGSDTASAGIAQIASCQTRTTMTFQAVEAAAKALGADPQTANNVGFAIDIAVPLAAGFVGAARAVAVTRGALSLRAEEAAGGHTIARHIGRTEAELRLRLTRQPAIPAASSFHTLAEAERAVAAALRTNKEAIKVWAKNAVPRDKIAFTYAADRVVGHGVLRSTGQLTNMAKVTVVLRKVTAQNRVYFVLTAFPTL
jgi:hypothetical protein